MDSTPDTNPPIDDHVDNEPQEDIPVQSIPVQKEEVKEEE